MFKKILSQMGYHNEPLSVTQFQNEEDNRFYNVWRVNYPKHAFVLKQAKGIESDIYRSFLDMPCDYAPRLFATANMDGSDYLLMEYIPGHNLMKCSRKDLRLTLDSLITMHRLNWMCEDSCKSYQRSLDSRINRGKYLFNERLETAYAAYLQEFISLPKTLCHDDLLPFNVIISENRAVFIDWEVGGILPYPTSLARLIAHTEEDENVLFFMKESDKCYAIDYFFEHFAKGRGVGYEAYRRSLDLFLFYEYCEWVYVGNKYGETDSKMFRKYSKLALEMACKLGY